MSIDHLYHNGRKGPVEPLPPPPGTILLSRPVRLKVGGWADHLRYDARFDLDGITWVRVEGGFGSGQHTGWHPREDWVAMLPALSLHVGRHFDRPARWTARGTTDFDTIEGAMRSEVRGAIRSSLYDLREAQRRLVRLERAVDMLGRARSRSAGAR